MKEFKRYLVTAALPYANGPNHIGHMAGVYIPADIFVRFQRAKKTDIKFVCGSDEHGVPITIRALKEGVSPQQIVGLAAGQMETNRIAEGINQGVDFGAQSAT